MRAGLEGVVAAETALSLVDGERGELIIGGYPVGELAPNATFEQVMELLGVRRLGAAFPRPDSRGRLSSTGNAMDALRMEVAAIESTGDDQTDAANVIAAFPTIVAAHARLHRGLEPIAPREDLRYAANYLYMLDGQEPSPARVRALETYLNTVVDHGLNASTFTARVIASTGSDIVSAVTGAIGALKGPLHGGAPGPALDTVFEIGDPSRAEPVLRRKLEAGEKLMGFGHRVYKVRDPRADVLAAAAERLFTSGVDRQLYDLARHVESVAIRLLDEYKPGRNLRTNVEFYTALLLHGIGLDVPLFTPTFAISRVVGWVAHAMEQRRANRLIRPQSVYVGPRGRRWAA
jgi:citrate synthase